MTKTSLVLSFATSSKFVETRVLTGLASQSLGRDSDFRNFFNLPAKKSTTKPFTFSTVILFALSAAGRYLEEPSISNMAYVGLESCCETFKKAEMLQRHLGHPKELRNSLVFLVANVEVDESHLVPVILCHRAQLRKTNRFSKMKTPCRR